MATEKAMTNYSFNQTKTAAKTLRNSEAVYTSVDLNSVATGEPRSLGPELAGHTTWQQLGFDQLLVGCGFSLSEQALAAGKNGTCGDAPCRSI